MADHEFTWPELMAYRTAKPFRPFFFEMKSGEQVEVLDALAFGGANDLLGIAHPEHGLRRFRRSDVTAARLMTAEEMAERLPLIAEMRRRA